MADQPESAGSRPNRRPALSPSRAADFKQCPLLYRFRAIDRLPEPPSTAQLRGSVVHTALEQLYGLPAEERVPDAAGALVEPAWEQVIAAEPDLTLEEIQTRLKAAHDLPKSLSLYGTAPQARSYPRSTLNTADHHKS